MERGVLVEVTSNQRDVDRMNYNSTAGIQNNRSRYPRELNISHPEDRIVSFLSLVSCPLWSLYCCNKKIIVHSSVEALKYIRFIARISSSTCNIYAKVEHTINPLSCAIIDGNLHKIFSFITRLLNKTFSIFAFWRRFAKLV